MRSWAAIYAALQLLPWGAVVQAQPTVGAVALPGSEADERLRLAAPATNGASATAGTFGAVGAFRRPARLTFDTTSRRLQLVLLAPELRLVSNSGLPFSINEGTLWAGRGTNRLVTGGFAITAGPFDLQLAPQHTTSENRRFQVIPFPQGTTTPSRSVWANPFHPPASSIDLPYRPGDQPLARTVIGQSHLTLSLPRVRLGLSTEHQWWGPAMRHPLLLGASSEGFPHLFVETARGLSTPLGQLSAQWLLGTLRESPVFDNAAANNRRALNGAVVALTPRGDSALTLGIMRLVMSSSAPRGLPFSRSLDLFRSVGQPVQARLPVPVGGVQRDQITALFARYVFPAAGFEGYLEWARFAEPVSLADLLEYPGYSQGYTMGLQYSRATRAGTLRLAAEATNTEPDASIRVRPVATSYTSRTVPQGFTHRGRMLANPLGPGASGQWFAADLFASRLRLGAFAGRIRWDNATLWEPIIPQVKLEDITLLAGLRGSLRVGPARLASRVGVEYTSAVRLSYLYQSKLLNWSTGENGGVDLPNRTLAITWSTIAFR